MHYFVDSSKRRIDLYFDEIPSNEIRDFLKADGWHWNRTKQCWYSVASQANIDTAQGLGASQWTEYLTHRNEKTETIPKQPTYFFNALYAAPEKVEDIRRVPALTEELIQFGLSPDDTFNYYKLCHRLYVDAQKQSSDYRAELFLRQTLIDFCISHKLIRAWPGNISGHVFYELAANSFEDFRLNIERILAGIDPGVQFVKIVYGVDIINFQWWTDTWLPTLEMLGHNGKGTDFAALSLGELQALQRQICVDNWCGKHREFPSEIFDYNYLMQMISWNLEDCEDNNTVIDQTLYIHKGRIVCQTRNHKVEQVTAYLTSLTGSRITMNVSFCIHCQKYFMSYQAYLLYRKRYGVILGNLKMLTGEDFNQTQEILAHESTLHLCGYNVAEKNGLSSEERKMILLYILDNRVLKKEEVISHLSWLIETNSNRANMDNAISKWKDDLEFVLAYRIHEQRVQPINAIEKYRANNKSSF